MTICCVVGCSSRCGRDKVRFFSIPAVLNHRHDEERNLSIERRREWLKRINRANLKDKDVKKETVVCSKHFISGLPAKLREKTSPDWAPSLNMGYKSNLEQSSHMNAARHERARRRKKNIVTTKAEKMDFEIASESGFGCTKDIENGKNSITEEGNGMVVNESGVGCMTDISGELFKKMNEEMEKLREDNALLSRTVTELKTELDACRKSSDSIIAELKVELDACRKVTDSIIADFETKMEECKNKYESIRMDNLCLSEKKKVLEAEIIYRSVNEKAFQLSDKKVKFYTGLPKYTLLKKVFELVTKNLEFTLHSALPLFEEFILVLMRLRLNLREQDLAYRFNISQSTASRIISKWLPLLYARLKCFIVWPDRETLQHTMPECFKENFGKSVAVILDCFEVFIDKPSSLKPRTATWSQYKHHNTAKFLIGITPQGSISYVSNSWHGRTSDKELTESCGILNNLEKGDVVLADRGFNIEDSVGMMYARLNIPAFTKGKPQLSYEDVESTRKIANVRIHVERVIGVVRRKYSILSGTLPIDTLTVREGESLAPIDQIATICCALVNLCPSIIPQ